MSDTAVIVGVTFVALLLVSFMLGARLQASGASGQAARLIAQLWLTVGVITALLAGIAQVLGRSARNGVGTELQDIGARFATLPAESRLLVGAGGVLVIGLFVYLLHTIGTATRGAKPAS